MRDERSASWATVDRRTILGAGAAIAAGLGSSPAAVGATQDDDSAWPDDPEWPVGAPDEDEADDWDDDDDFYDGDGQTHTVADDTGTIRLTVPLSWDDLDGRPIDLGPSLTIAPDVEGYVDTWDVPGIEVVVTTELEPDLDRVLDEYGDFSTDCADAGRETSEIGDYDYRAQFWYACNDTETEYLVLAGVPDDWMGALRDVPYVVLVGTQIVDERDIDPISDALVSLAVD